MTADEILAVIRERVTWWRNEATILSPNQGTAVAGKEIINDLDPDRIDPYHRLRADLIRDLSDTGIQRIMTDDLADALLKKGWKK